MATVDRRRLTLLVVAAVLWSAANGEIHRAKSLNVRPRPHQHDQYQYPAAGSLWPPDYAGRLLALRPSPASRGDGNDTGAAGGGSWMTEVVWGHEAQTWVYSVVSACLVGLSGIFPLVVIPIEAGRSLRSGAANHRLKLLLSFAVGGLLGDVFLHLLPETWAHLQQFNGDRKGHLNVGFWILTGLLSFFIIQKIFPESEEEEAADGEQEEENETQQKKAKEKLTSSKEVPESYDKPGTATVGGEKANGTVSNGRKRGKKLTKKEKRKNGLSHVTTENRVAVSPDAKEVVLDRECYDESDGSSKERPVEGWIDSLKGWVLGGGVQNPVQNSHIKTSGWLNLMANMIDNFTHGLAVAGSYSVSLKTGMLTTVAILLHEIPHEIGDFAILLRAGFDRWKAAKAQLVTATGGMLGALIALAAESTKEAGESTAWILPFTAGGFIYIALVTVVPDLLKETHPWHSLKQLVFLCAGIFTMAAVGALVD